MIDSDKPAFWDIKTDLKPGEFESDMMTMFFNQAIDLHKENQVLKDRIKRLEEAGDALSETQTYDLIQNINWRKAKEAKP